ncbi:MAG: hypothetical protein LC776_07735, partial [Acidobacteria bacterium]|nr:hypothetical protein [Acidobacteriota bacterium]
RDVAEGIEATQNFLDAEAWDQAAQVAIEVANFLAQHSNLQRLSFAAQVLSVLPPHHHDCYLFVDHEGAALVALGFTNEAVDRYRNLVEICSQRAHAEPGRADYQRDLSISYQRIGLCLAQLGRADDAATMFERHLKLAFDVYQRSPGQVNAVVDLTMALHLTATLNDQEDERNRQSRELLEALEADQRLPRHGKVLLENLRRGEASSHRRHQ